ncbi:hypothetical protein [Pseudarthrobacter sp. N5]|uniref:hypothetical protein n=1 Tax=Pseudarthrobacter sp. N5 TaxID=3418416 RepID=UPI003CEFE985
MPTGFRPWTQTLEPGFRHSVAEDIVLALMAHACLAWAGGPMSAAFSPRLRASLFEAFGLGTGGDLAPPPSVGQTYRALVPPAPPNTP